MGSVLKNGLVNRSLVLLVGAQAATALLGLVAGKLIAVYLPPAEVGNYNLVYVSLMLANTVLITPTLKSMRALLPIAPPDAVLRFHVRVMLLVYAGLLMGIGLWGTLTDHGLLALLAGLAIGGQGFYALGLEYMNAYTLHGAFSRTQIGYSLAHVLLIILLVVSEQRNQIGLWAVLATLNSGFAGMIVLMYPSLKKAFGQIMTFEWPLFWEPFWTYVRPLLGAAVCVWIVNYADRYFIEQYGTSTDVGHYSVGYSLGSKLVLLSMPVQAYLTPLVMQLKADGQKPSASNPLLLRAFWLYGLGAGLVSLLFFGLSAQVGSLLLSARYQPSFTIAPIIAVAYLGITAGHILEIKLYTFSKTRSIFSCYLVGAVLNVLFNALLTPSFGIVGAAVATVFSTFGQLGTLVYFFLKTK